MLSSEQKVELIQTAQDLFLPHESARTSGIEAMSTCDIKAKIVEPFTEMITRKNLESIQREYDKELTLKPALTDRSEAIALSRYKADLDRSQVAIDQLD